MTEKIIAAGGVVTNPKGEILFMFRRGKWDLPKGKLDEGETVEECAVREVNEETGLNNIELGKLIYITLHHYVEVGREIEKETYWYIMKIIADQPLIPQTEEDILELQWVDKNQLEQYLANTYENIREVIAKWKNMDV